MRYFFNPRSVVLIGVSRKSGTGAYNNLEIMLRYGYKGRIYVVHPEAPEILGHKTYSRISDLPEAPDLAIMSVGRDRILPAFEECVERGAKRAIVISQGFADADEQGRELQKQLAETARERGARVVGPNTIGVYNCFANFTTSFVDTVRDSRLAPLAIVAQSGVFQVAYDVFTLHASKAIDLGNMCDVDYVDVLEYLENDPETKIIVLHMEGLKRGRRFLEVAERVARRKPIIVLKIGRSAAGAKAALSHSGSLAGEDAIFDAAFAKAGLIRVKDTMELKSVCNAFLHYSPQAMKGPRLGVVTGSGAAGIMTADACEEYGLEIAPFPEEIRHELENPHIAWHKLHNPADVWPLGMVTGSFADLFKRTICGLLKSEKVDAVLGMTPSFPSLLHDDLDLLESVREINRINTERKPVALWPYGGNQANQAERIKDEPDVAYFETLEAAVIGFAALWRYQKLQRERAGEAPRFAQTAAGKPCPDLLPPKGVLLGPSAFALLDSYGIPLAPGRLAQNLEEAAAIADEIGYPVVLKIVSPQWLHKSDMGGALLDIKSRDELQQSFARLTRLFENRTPEGILEGVLVQKQMRGFELLLGIKRDPQLGPAIIVGMGGIYAEVFKDVARGIAPLTRPEALKMLEALRIYPILKGARGQKGIDMDVLLDALLALSQMALDYPRINELDLNPVIAGPEGCWCVDCRLVPAREYELPG